MSVCLVMLMFLSALSQLMMCFFPLWPAGGVLHFHPDNVCSEDRDKVSIKHGCCCLGFVGSWKCFLTHSPLLFVLFLFSPDNHPPALPLCTDGRQPEPEKAASFPAVHVGSQLRPSFYSFLSHSPLGAASQSQTTPPLHAREMPHASSQPTQVREWCKYSHYL